MTYEPMKPPIRWGIIGCGDVTEVKSGPAFSKVEGSELTAVMRRNGDLARDYAKRHGVPKWYDDANQLMDDPDVDAVYVATPPSSHAEYTIRSLRAGKPVYVEKPMARTSEECERMIEAAEVSGLPLLVAYYRRCLPSFLFVKRLVDEKRIGEVRMVRVKLVKPAGTPDQESSPSNWRVMPKISGGGYFIDLAAHQFDFLGYVFGQITSVVGIATNQAGLYPAEDAVSAAWEHESGVLGVGSWCFSASPEAEQEETEIIGSEGRIRFSFFGDPDVLVDTAGHTERVPFEYPVHVQQPLIETVVAHLSGNGECPSTGVRAARTTRVMEKILADTPTAAE